MAGQVGGATTKWRFSQKTPFDRHGRRRRRSRQMDGMPGIDSCPKLLVRDELEVVGELVMTANTEMVTDGDFERVSGGKDRGAWWIWRVKVDSGEVRTVIHFGMRHVLFLSSSE